MSLPFSSMQIPWEPIEKYQLHSFPVVFSQEGYIFFNGLHGAVVACFVLWEMSRLVSDSLARHLFQASGAKCQPVDNKWWGADSVVTQVSSLRHRAMAAWPNTYMRYQQIQLAWFLL